MGSDRSVIQRRRSRIRPRARLIRAIGEDLISSPTIALVELIKNAYDADAECVIVRFESPLEVGRGAIEVIDDGHGMDAKAVETGWLEPATIAKRKTSLSKKKKRRMTGEKGLGRFAAARLADSMELVSVTRRPLRVVDAVFDWEDFSDEEKYLDQLRCEWGESVPARGTPSGTTLRLVGLRKSWDLEDFRRLRGELARLIARPADAGSFEIVLELPPEFSDYSGKVTPPDVLEQPHYSLLGSLGADGALDAVISIRGDESEIQKVLALRGPRDSTCGPFDFEFRVWDRDRENLKEVAETLGTTVRNIRADLDQACGISLYRDSFRVLPYGAQDDDWLRLDARRVDNPTLRLNNKQIVGQVFISAADNPGLRDQTNREGLIETQELIDLREFLALLLAEIEARRYDARRDSPVEIVEQGVFAGLDIAPIRESFETRYPNDAEFLEFLQKRERDFRSSVERVQEVVARYRRLATLGQLIDVLLHDGRTPIATIANEAELARQDLKGVDDAQQLRDRLDGRIDVVVRQSAVLTRLLQRIASCGGRKRGRPNHVRLEQIVSDTFELQTSRLEALSVRTSLPTGNTEVTVDPVEMQQVFLNLLENSLYWLEQAPEAQRAIAVGIERRDGDVEVVFSDSGPGVPDEYVESIFDPYFSAKPDGVGLGLTIAGEVAAEYGGTLELMSDGPLPGATFRVVLKRRVGGGEDGD